MADPTSGYTGITQFPARSPGFILPSNGFKLEQSFHFLQKSFIECQCYSLEKCWEFRDGIVHFFSVLEVHNGNSVAHMTWSKVVGMKSCK